VAAEACQADLVRKFECEEANLRLALRRSIDDHRAEDSARLTLGLARLWQLCGRGAEAWRSLGGVSATDTSRLGADEGRPATLDHSASDQVASSASVADNAEAFASPICTEIQPGGRDRTDIGVATFDPSSVALEARPMVGRVVQMSATASVEQDALPHGGETVAPGPDADADRDRDADDGQTLTHLTDGEILNRQAPPTHVAKQADKSAPVVILSERELSVATLVASGRSNREIAEELVISRKTAEAHVSHILTKLGLWRRVQIATWSVQQGLKPAAAD
jgi:DNA-binding CsgD family transcriptional regulator